LSIGSIVKRHIKIDDKIVEKEFHCMTASFDHD